MQFLNNKQHVRCRAGEAEAAGDAGHDGRDEVVEVAKGGHGHLQRAEADVIQRLIVQHHALVRILDQLVHGQRRIVWLYHCIGHLEDRTLLGLIS